MRIYFSCQIWIQYLTKALFIIAIKCYNKQNGENSIHPNQDDFNLLFNLTYFFNYVISYGHSLAWKNYEAISSSLKSENIILVEPLLINIWPYWNVSLTEFGK